MSTVNATAIAPAPTETYSRGRVIYDADSHIMEAGDWLEGYADAKLKAKLKPMFAVSAGPAANHLAKEVGRARTRLASRDGQLVAEAEAELLTRKGWSGYGATFAQERPRAMDLLGFKAQLVFGTFAAGQFRGGDEDTLYEGADAFNRGMVDFCSVDPRFLPVGFCPIADLDRAMTVAERAIKGGVKALHIPADALPEVSPAHPSYDRFWALLAEAGVPFVHHIGGETGRIVARSFNNAGFETSDFLGGGENIRSKDYMAIHMRPEIFVACLVLDGVFERHPTLKGGVIEDGAMWVVPWLKRLDYAQRTFARNEPHLNLPMKASEYVRRNLKFTPFHNEPVGWMIEQSYDDLYMFSSDYPHTEGTKDPIGKFEATMAGIGEVARKKFYEDNFKDMMGL